MSQFQIHRSEDRGRAEEGWLKSRHSFSFGDYYNPKRMNFGALRVLNEDWVQPAEGFPTHAHDNMEIVTIVLEGLLEHKDSEGNHGLIKPGDVQRMSAGTGIRHSEFNHSKTEVVHLLQIWIHPEKRGLKPGYEQKFIAPENLKNHFQILVSAEQTKEALTFNQDARFSRGIFDAGRTVSYPAPKAGQGLYLFVISGEIDVRGETLRTGDAGLSSDGSPLDFRAIEKSDLLVIEVPL